MLTAQLRLALAVAAEAGLLIAAQAEPISSSFLSSNVFDAGTTVAALGLLAYILRLMFSGDLVSKQTIESVVEKAVRDTLAEERLRR